VVHYPSAGCSNIQFRRTLSGKVRLLFLEECMARQAYAATDSPWLFFALTLGWSGFFFSAAAIASRGVPAGPATLFHALGGIGPLLAAVVLVYARGNAALRRDFWLRMVDARRIPLRWAATILILMPTATFLAALLDTAWGGDGLQLDAAARFVTRPLTIVPFAFFILVFGRIPEEPGWRGYALDRLQVRWSAFGASLILGVVWALWHLPLFFVAGSYQHSLGAGTLSFWRYLFSFLPDAVLYTWIYNNANRSTLAAILFHFMTNLTGELFGLTPRAEIFLLLLWVLLAAAVVRRYGPATLVRTPSPGTPSPSARPDTHR
jgi:uncharacterized protein